MELRNQMEYISDHQDVSTSKWTGGQVEDWEHQLHEYYIHEIEGNLDKIQTSLIKLEQDVQDKESVIQIVDASQAIEDLAMIHGFEQVEAMAQNILKIIRQQCSPRRRPTKDVLFNIESVVQTIREEVNLEQPLEKDLNLISSPPASENEKPKPEVKSLKDEKKLIDQKEIENEDIEEEYFFDIKEDNSLMSLLKEEPEDSEEIDLGFLEEYPKPKPASPEMQKEDLDEIKQVFNEIFREEAIENLDFLKQAISKLKEGQFLGEAIMRIKESFSSLKDSAQSLKINGIKEALILLNRLAKEKLIFNSRPSDEILNVLSDAEQALRDFVENENPGEVTFHELLSRIENILTPEDEKETVFEDKSPSDEM